jgi:hypothetical protein
MSNLRRLSRAVLFSSLLVTGGATPALGQTLTATTQPDLRQVIESLGDRGKMSMQLDYIMTARVRLLFSWAGKNDVGAARIRRGTSPQDPGGEWIDLVAGSDPAKAPRAINRWGSASESFNRTLHGWESSTFFGFMKVSKGSSTAELQKELSREKQNQEFLFSAIVDHAGGDSEFVKILPFTSAKDYTIKDLDQATSAVVDRLAGPQGRVKAVDAARRHSCERVAGFLSTVAELVGAAVANPEQRLSLCYLYNGERHALILRKVTPVAKRTIELSLANEPKRYARTYQDLLLAEIEDKNEENGKRSSFGLLLGTKGELREVPVQISYQPNWWFQVILDLQTPQPFVNAQYP